MPLRIDIVEQELITAATSATRFDAVIYPASTDLAPNSPDAAALYEAAGPNLAVETAQLAPCPVGEARISRAYDLSCSYLIHAVPPRWGGGEAGEDKILAGCYRNALNFASTYDINTVVIAALGEGEAAFPRMRAAHIAMTELLLFLETNPAFGLAMLCCPDEALAQCYESAFDKYAA